MVDFSQRVSSKLQFSNSRTSANSQHLVRCKSRDGRISLLQRKFSTTRVGRRGIGFAHQFSRIESRKGESVTGQARGSGQVALGQQDCCGIHNADGRNQKQSVKLRGLSDVERSHCIENKSSVPSVVVNKGEHGGRLPQPKQPSSVGVRVIQRNFFVHSRPFQHLSKSRCLRKQGDSPAQTLHVMVSRSSSCSTERLDSPLGPSVISFSPSADDYEMSTQNQGRESGGDHGDTPLANFPVVAIDSGTDGGTSAPPVSLQNDSVNDKSSGSAIPQSTCSSSSETLNATASVDKELDSFLSNHLAPGTKSGYSFAFAKFSTYCLSLKQSPTSCGPDIIARYIKHLFDSGCSYSSVNGARCAISKHHVGYDGMSAGSHKLVSMAVKSVFKQRPPLPKYKTTFDITVVLTYLQSLPNNKDLSLKLLSYKALFLLTISSISRMSSAARLGSNLLVCKVRYFLFSISNHILTLLLQDHCIINLVDLEKHSTTKNVRGYLRIQQFHDDPVLCPVSALVEYHSRVSGLHSTFVIICYCMIIDNFLSSMLYCSLCCQT